MKNLKAATMQKKNIRTLRTFKVDVKNIKL